MDRHLIIVIIVAVLTGLIGGIITAQLMKTEPRKEELIKTFYLTENAVHVSPHSLRKLMDNGDNSFVLVDLRSHEEYEQSHIRGAINIPAYKNKDESDYGAKDRIVSEFRALPKDKDIIVYCYSTACMTGRKIGEMVAREGIFVKHLGIGWNEWRYEWNDWNHEHEWNLTNVENYIWSGNESGPLKKVNDSGGCPAFGSLGC